MLSIVVSFWCNEHLDDVWVVLPAVVACLHSEGWVFMLSVCSNSTRGTKKAAGSVHLCCSDKGNLVQAPLRLAWSGSVVRFGDLVRHVAYATYSTYQPLRQACQKKKKEQVTRTTATSTTTTTTTTTTTATATATTTTGKCWLRFLSPP